MYGTRPITSMMMAQLMLLLGIVASVLADRESLPDVEKHTAHDPVRERHYTDGEHNMEFDHESILGSVEENEEFSHLSEEEAKERLAVIVGQMDKDQNKFISKDELVDWIMKSYIELDFEEAKDKMKDADGNEDGYLTWREYLTNVYDYSPEELAEMDKDESQDVQAFMKMVDDDDLKFKAADENRDQLLDVKEYAAFLHPYDFQHMHDLEVDTIISNYDKNKDGFIEAKEFIGEEDSQDKEKQISEMENFKDYDQDSDGKLDRTEVRSWVLPDHKDAAADEAVHLFEDTDANGDGKLTQEEILAQHQLWVGSSANSGSFHDPEEL